MINHPKINWKPKSDEELNKVIAQSRAALPVLNDEEELKSMALLFKALGDVTRLTIIGILKVQESCLCELVAGLRVPSSTLTHHLQILERGGVVQSRKEGKFTIFSLVQNQIIDKYLTQSVKGVDHRCSLG